MEVYKAINAVQRALAKCGITKDRRNQSQGYNFRGIDDVYNALSPLLAEHGLCILPRCTSRTCEERQTAKGGTLFYVTVSVEFDFVAASDGSKHTVSTFGEAMDSADKATNKAMSMAYKYSAFMVFAIPTEGDNDADATTPEPVSPRQNAAPPQPQPKPQSEQQAAFNAWIKPKLDAGDITRDEVKAELSRAGGDYAKARLAIELLFAAAAIQ